MTAFENAGTPPTFGLDHLALLISLDGLEEDNDIIRGNNVFNRICSAINNLLALRKEGKYKGKISICLTISDHTIGKLYEFINHFNAAGIDTCLLYTSDAADE